MKKGKLVLILACVMFAAAFTATGIIAGTTVPDVVKMQHDYKHKKGIVEFSHKKHVTEYKATCGDCHHDDKGQPLADLKEGDDVKSCFECHNKPGELKGKKAKGLSDAEKMAYHANAMHENCIGCHKKYNKENKTKAAPQSCSKCHPKKK